MYSQFSTPPLLHYEQGFVSNIATLEQGCLVGGPYFCLQNEISEVSRCVNQKQAETKLTESNDPLKSRLAIHTR